MGFDIGHYQISRTAYDIAERYIGRKEVSGAINDPAIMHWLKLDHDWPHCDEVPWCSAFVNWVCWLMKLPRSKSLMARSWLTVGERILYPCRGRKGWDVAVFKVGKLPQPGSKILDAPGHVGFFLSYDQNKKRVFVLGGNQRNQVSVGGMSESRLLGIRRLYTERKGALCGQKDY